MKPKYRLPARLATLLLTLFGAHGACAAADAAAPARPQCTTNATPRTVAYPWMSIERWKQMHADQVARAEKGSIDVMFVGDSITEMWPSLVWQANFGHLKAANFGIGGDHTGNVLWRLRDPSIASIKPKLVVLLIGVNNLNLCGETPEQVFEGIRAVLAALRKQYPAARILLNAVLPTGEAPDSPERQRVAALDQPVATLGDGKRVVLRDYGPRFIRADGKLSVDLQPDFLHFTEKGYRIWADAMGPDIEQLLK